MTIELSPTEIAFWGTACAAVGWCANFYVGAYRIKKGREHAEQDRRDNRRRHLLAFLNVWAAEVQADRKITNANNVAQGVADRFDEKRHELIGKATLVEPDVSEVDRAKFSELVTAITERMTPGSVDGQAGRNALLGAIHKLAEKVRNV